MAAFGFSAHEFEESMEGEELEEVDIVSGGGPTRTAIVDEEEDDGPRGLPEQEAARLGLLANSMAHLYNLLADLNFAHPDIMDILRSRQDKLL